MPFNCSLSPNILPFICAFFLKAFLNLTLLFLRLQSSITGAFYCFAAGTCHMVFFLPFLIISLPTPDSPSSSCEWRCLSAVFFLSSRISFLIPGKSEGKQNAKDDIFEGEKIYILSVLPFSVMSVSGCGDDWFPLLWESSLYSWAGLPEIQLEPSAHKTSDYLSH